MGRRAGLWGLLGAGVATCTPRYEGGSAVIWRLAISLAAGGIRPGAMEPIDRVLMHQ